MTWVAAVFFAGAADRIYLTFGIPYGAQIWFWRAVALGGPFLVFFVVRRLLTDILEEEPEVAAPTGFEAP